MVLATQSEHVTFWWIALGMGPVVIIAVIVLLSLLVSFVNDIDTNLKDAWGTATWVAQNTSTTWMLQESAKLGGALADEAERHVELLSARTAAR